MFEFIAAMFLAAQHSYSVTDVGRTAWVFSTVGQSEWCPAGNVILDLRTGRYALTPRASRAVCNDPKLERPVTRGTLTGKQLRLARSAYLRALSEGLENPVCRGGARPDDIVLENGGTKVLMVTSGALTLAAPDDLTCWSEAASALKELLNREFSPGDYR